MSYFYKPEDNCLQKVEAACTYYRLDIPEFSDLSQNECSTVEETTQDIYSNLDSIIKETDLSGLDESCIDYQEQDPGNPTVKEFALKIDEEVCLLKEKQTSFDVSLCEASIEECDLDLKNLTDSCNVIPTTQKELFQTLIDEIEILKNKVATLEQNL